MGLTLVKEEEESCVSVRHAHVPMMEASVLHVFARSSKFLNDFQGILEQNLVFVTRLLYSSTF